MFEEYFRHELSKINTDLVLIEKLWSEIELNYSHKARYYHTLTHLNGVVQVLEKAKEYIQDWGVIVFSIAYHDIVYNIHKGDNEAKSADLAKARLKVLGIRNSQIEKCTQQILATKGHRLSDDPDVNYFTDADLSILGAESSDYLQYTQQIRKEYKSYPSLIYNQGRRKVLRHFLDMENIFKTEFFRSRYEKQARLNIILELENL